MHGSNTASGKSVDYIGGGAVDILDDYSSHFVLLLFG